MRVMDFFIAAKVNMVFRRRLIFRKERRTMENDLFEKMPVPKAYMKLAFPVVLSMMVSLVYNMVDTYFIALTGVKELVAGVSLVVPVFTMMIAFGDIFGIGGSSAISRLFGEKKDEEAKHRRSFYPIRFMQRFVKATFGYRSICLIQKLILINSWKPVKK